MFDLGHKRGLGRDKRRAFLQAIDYIGDTKSVLFNIITIIGSRGFK